MDKRVPMIAHAKFKHEGKMLRVNDPFETDEDNAADLLALRMAVRDEHKPRAYRRRDMRSEK